MKKTIIAITAVALLVPVSNAWAGKHHPMTEAEQENCLMTDGNGAGETWCLKSGAGMSKAQIDAFFRREGEKAAARIKKASEASYSNCLREKEDAQRLGEWIGPPSAEECRQFAAPQVANDAGNARLHHALNEEIMKQCNRMADMPGTDWQAVATLRGVTVTIDDCVKCLERPRH